MSLRGQVARANAHTKMLYPIFEANALSKTVPSSRDLLSITKLSRKRTVTNTDKVSARFGNSRAETRLGKSNSRHECRICDSPAACAASMADLNTSLNPGLHAADRLRGVLSWSGAPSRYPVPQ